MSWSEETVYNAFPYLMDPPGIDNFDIEANSLQGDVKKLIESTGLTDICKGIGFMDKINVGEKPKKVYDATANGNISMDKYVNTPVRNGFDGTTQNLPVNTLEVQTRKTRKRKSSDLVSSEDDDDMTEETEDQSKKNKRTSGKSKENKGLRHFSKRVCDKVKAKKKTTYNEVADELVKELSQNSELSGGRVDSKNIRRRVYDALNVLMAMNIIEKEKKEIRWRGLPTTDVKKELQALQADKQQRLERIQKKKEYLSELDTQKVLYKNLIERNSQLGAINEEERIFLPFIIIHTKKQTAIECEMSEDRTEYFFDFSLPFSIHDDNEILKRMGLAVESPGKTVKTEYNSEPGDLKYLHPGGGQTVPEIHQQLQQQQLHHLHQQQLQQQQQQLQQQQQQLQQQQQHIQQQLHQLHQLQQLDYSSQVQYMQQQQMNYCKTQRQPPAFAMPVPINPGATTPEDESFVPSFMNEV